MDQELEPIIRPTRLQAGIIAIMLTLNFGGMVTMAVGLGYALTVSNENNAILKAHDDVLADNARLSRQCIATAAVAADKAQLAATEAADTRK